MLRRGFFATVLAPFIPAAPSVPSVSQQASLIVPLELLDLNVPGTKTKLLAEFPQGLPLTNAAISRLLKCEGWSLDKIVKSCIPITGTWKSDDGIEYHYRDGKLHRDDGPAIVCPNGRQCYYRDGKLHRDDGPAIVCPNGEQHYYRDGKYHRDDGPAVVYAGPAIVYADGNKYYYCDGKPHRDDGPAIVMASVLRQTRI